MKAVEKLPWLTGLELQTEGFIGEAIANFQNLDENMLNQPALNGGWSIVQCLEHLNTYGRYYLPKLQEEIEKGHSSDLSGVYKPTLLGAYLIRLMDVQKSRVKLKAVKRHQPDGSLPAHQIVAEFIDQQEDILYILSKAHYANLNREKIPLSIASWIRLPVGDILHFMVVHTQRHVLQANRTRHQSGM